MNREVKWTEEVLRYLFEMAVAVTEYRTINMTKGGFITAGGVRTIKRLMQIRFGFDKFEKGVGHQLAFITSGQNRSEFERNMGFLSTFDRVMHAALFAGFISGSEFAERMTN